jgi:hypothetical protein
MNKALTLSQRCSPNLFTEQLTQQQLYIRLIGKLLRLSMSLSTLSKLPNLPAPMSTLSNFAETRMDKGFHKDAHLNTLNEQLDSLKSPGPSRRGHLCGTQDREKALVTGTPRGGHIGVAGGHFGVASDDFRVVCVVNGWSSRICSNER